MKTIKIVVVSVVALILLWFLLRAIPGFRFVSDFFTPIVFYGKVIDEKGDPVPLAQVLISFVNTPGESHTKGNLETDSRGCFSTRGIGLAVVVQVSKKGYYNLDKSSGTFSYVAAGGLLDRHASSSNPAIFVLRKMGQAEPLIYKPGHSQEIARDGTPIQMNLTTGYTYQVTNGDIQVECWTHDEGIPPNGNHPFDWRSKISVPGGGIRLRTGGEFDFIAPKDGYQPSDEINMPATAPKWRDSQSREYFLKLANGTYARISFVIGAGAYNSFEITSYLNPIPGHRNLEYDPNQAISK